MCFGLEEPVVSASVAPDGSCVLCGFGSGVVRLFDLAASANAHPEDRWGCALGHLGVRDGAAVLVHVEVSSDGKFGFAGARAGGKGVSCWDLESFRKLRETRGFASSTLVATHREADPRLRGLCSVATMASEDRFRSYRLLSGVGYGSMSVWDVVLPEHGSGGEATWSCVFHESAGGPALLGGVLAADGCRALTRVAEKRAAGGDGISLRASVAHVTSGERPLLADSVLTDRKKFSDVAVVLAVFDATRDAGVLKVGRLASFDANDLRVGDGDLVVSDDVGVCDPAKVRSGGRCWACGDCATHWEESARDALRPSYREAERKRKPEDDEVQLIEAPAEKPAAADGPPAKKKTKQAAPASLRSEVHEALVEALAKNRALTAARAAADALEEERKKQASTCVVCAEAESRVALAPCGHMCLCPTDAAQLHAKGMLRKCPVCKQPVTATVVVREVRAGDAFASSSL
ncbi:Zinc finger protein [Aureococcus anophagefferens]|nr:Zinc finger protein [Aureococcus anophagefferens]